jgi:hypothetical protein
MAHLRRHSRYEARLPVEIESPAKPGRIAVARNVSQGGLLLGTPSRFAAGQRVRVRFRTRRDGPQYELPGTIVRAGRDANGEWLSRLVAVEFDRTVNERRIHEIAQNYRLYF